VDGRPGGWGVEGVRKRDRKLETERQTDRQTKGGWEGGRQRGERRETGEKSLHWMKLVHVCVRMCTAKKRLRNTGE